jgi:hypothetical protein
MFLQNADTHQAGYTVRNRKASDLTMNVFWAVDWYLLQQMAVALQIGPQTWAGTTLGCTIHLQVSQSLKSESVISL